MFLGILQLFIYLCLSCVLAKYCRTTEAGEEVPPLLLRHSIFFLLLFLYPRLESWNSVRDFFLLTRFHSIFFWVFCKLLNSNSLSLWTALVEISSTYRLCIFWSLNCLSLSLNCFKWKLFSLLWIQIQNQFKDCNLGSFPLSYWFLTCFCCNGGKASPRAPERKTRALRSQELHQRKTMPAEKTCSPNPATAQKKETHLPKSHLSK